MPSISIISKASHQVLQTVDSSQVKEITLTENSVVVIDIPKEDVAKFSREGNDAIIVLKNGETIVIHNYFNNDNSADNSIVFDDGTGQLYWAEFTDENGVISDTIKYHLIDDVDPLLYHDDMTALILPWVGGGAALAGVAAAIDNDNDKSNPVPPKKPVVTENNKGGIGGTGEPGTVVVITDGNGKTTTAIVDSKGNWHIGPENPLKEGEKGTIEAVKPDGTGSGKDPITGGDQTPPAAPDIDPVNPTAPITGTGEPGSKITVTFPDGKTATTVVDPNGKWTVANPGLKDGDEIKAVATDPAGNVSPEAKEIVDGIPPATPDIDPVNPTAPITGTGEPGSKITVTFPDGKTATTVVDPNGKWTVANPGLKNGDEIKAVATDPAGNVSPEAKEIVDGIPPATPDINPVNPTAPITGTGEPGSKITVTFPDGKTATTVVDPNGKWTVANPGLKDGEPYRVCRRLNILRDYSDEKTKLYPRN